MRERKRDRRKLDALRAPRVERHGQRRAGRRSVVGRKAREVVREMSGEAVGVDREDRRVG